MTRQTRVEHKAIVKLKFKSYRKSNSRLAICYSNQSTIGYQNSKAKQFLVMRLLKFDETEQILLI